MLPCRAALSSLALVVALSPRARATETTGETAAPTPERMAAPDSEARRVPVHFATAEPGVTVYSRPVPPERRRGEDAAGEPSTFEPLCRAPCDATLDPTLYEFALAPAGAAPIPATPAYELRADAKFRADVISHSSRRTTGVWILGVMGAVGATSTTIGLLQTCVDDQTCQEWTSLAIWSGIAVMAAGALIGLPMMATSDEATLTLLPGTAPLPGPPGAELPENDRLFVANGATLLGHF